MPTSKELTIRLEDRPGGLSETPAAPWLTAK